MLLFKKIKIILSIPFKGMKKVVFNRSKIIFIIKLVDGCLIRTCAVYLQIYHVSKPISAQPEINDIFHQKAGLFS